MKEAKFIGSTPTIILRSMDNMAILMVGVDKYN